MAYVQPYCYNFFMLYLVRHGQTQANVDVVFSGGRSDVPLTKVGREQAYAEGERILREHIAIDRIITSPVKRAIHTAEIIAAVIGIEQEDIKTDKRLVEYDLGELDGKSARGVTARERVTASGAEDPVAFQRWVMACVNDMKKLSGNTLLVSHDAVGRIIRATQLGVDPHDFYEVEKYPNAQIVELG